MFAQLLALGPALDGTLSNQREDRAEFCGWNLPARACPGGRYSRRQLAAGELHSAVRRAGFGAAQCRNRRYASSGDAAHAGGGSLDTTSLVDARGPRSPTPPVRRRSWPTPDTPPDDSNPDPLCPFVRNGTTAHGTVSRYQRILELAEACAVPVRWSCRTGVCHNCESGLVSGAVVYGPEPLDKPADGNVLVCCSQPICDVAIDL